MIINLSIKRSSVNSCWNIFTSYSLGMSPKYIGSVDISRSESQMVPEKPYPSLILDKECKLSFFIWWLILWMIRNSYVVKSVSNSWERLLFSFGSKLNRPTKNWSRPEVPCNSNSCLISSSLSHESIAINWPSCSWHWVRASNIFL